MAQPLTITAANSIYTLAIGGLFATPQQLVGFAADAAFAGEALAPAEVMMGVDGRMSAGWVPVEQRQTISLSADSPSILLFETWYSAQQQQRELYFASAQIIMPSVKRAYSCVKGVLSNYTPLADASKTLRPRTFGITWESVRPSTI